MYADRIRQIRKSLGLTQSEFGKNLGVSRDVICNIEYSRVEPKELFLSHVCSVYHVNPEWLFSGKGECLNEDADLRLDLEEAVELFTSLEPAFQDYALGQLRALLKVQSERNKQP